ncbi:MAG TPA: hypothetical protein VG267_00375 [Terracidiphilus sp.]|jgi:uncharacterized membrane protein|nr:hypothetical protein [Terracidiphilus sp.]
MSQESEPRTPLGGRMPLPGVAAIALYLLLMAGTIVVGVVGRHYGALYLLFAVIFVVASAGLVASFRWAWSLALAAVFLLMTYDLWTFAAQHTTAMAVQGFLNLVFFLYLVRPEVRAGLR